MARKGKGKSDDRVLLALACGATVESAAQKTGVCERTVYRLLADPAFRRRLQAFRAEMVQRAAGMLTAAGTESIKTLLALQQASIPPAVRLGAARTVLEMGVRIREAADLETRLTDLEQQIATIMAVPA